MQQKKSCTWAVFTFMLLLVSIQIWSSQDNEDHGHTGLCDAITVHCYFIHGGQGCIGLTYGISLTFEEIEPNRC